MNTIYIITGIMFTLLLILVFKIKKQNKFLWLSMIISLLLTLVVIYIPFLSNAFGLESISLAEYIVALLISITVIPMVEIVKFFQRRYQQKMRYIKLLRYQAIIQMRLLLCLQMCLTRLEHAA